MFEAHYEHRFLDDRLGVLVGLHDLNADFYVTEYSGLFLNKSFTIGPELTQIGPSVFPTTAPGIRLRLNGSAGLAVAHARNSDQCRRRHATLERAETTLEASYLITPKPWLSLQPDLQYVIDPSTDSSIDNALILGMRVQVTL